MKNVDRRTFLKKAAATTIGATLLKAGSPCIVKGRELDSVAMPTRRLGRTGYEASILSLGGQSTIETDGTRDQSVEIIHRALDLGMNYIDTSERYGNGISETYIGEVMKDRRDEVFLTTKTFQRSAEGLIENNFADSCERLQTDYIDLYLMHAVNNMETLNQVLDPQNGAIHAFEELKAQGRIGHIGLSSHSTEVLTAALERYDMDCIFLTINAAGMSMNQSPSETRAFLKRLAETDVGVIAMKLTGRNRIFDTGLSMEDSVRYSLSAGRNGSHFPIATATIGITSVDQVDDNVRLAKQYRPCNETEMDRIEQSVNG